MEYIAVLRARISNLIGNKNSGQRVDNDLHDTGIKLVNELLASRFPGRKWELAVNNLSGIDLRGYLGKNLDVVCEVNIDDIFLDDRYANIMEDLQRLQDSGANNKFLGVVNPDIQIQLKKLQSKDLLKDVEVIDLPECRFEKLE